MGLGNLVWTFLIYACTAGIVFVVFRLVAEEKLEAGRSQTQLLLRARQADRAETRPKIAEAPVRTVKNIPFRLIR